MRLRSFVGIMVPISLLLIGGCKWMRDDKGIFVDRSDDYVAAREGAPLEVPEDLSALAISDVMAVPPLPPSSGRRVTYEDETPRPEAIFARDEAQGVKIQKLGERRWLLVPQAPDVVWPKVKQFFADNGVGVAEEHPEGGALTTVWLGPADGSAKDVVHLAIRAGREEANVRSGRDRIKVVVEQGIRERTAEVHVRYQNDSVALPSEVALPEASDIDGVELELVSELGSYLASNVGDESVSFVARNISTQTKSELVRTADDRPALRLALDFNRAWAMINQALADAQVPITDVDRTAGIVYAEISDKILNQEGEGWFLKRWLTRDKKSRPVEVRMRDATDAFEVSVSGPGGAAIAADTAEQLLLLIREFAT